MERIVLPIHDRMSWLARSIELTSILLAIALAIGHLVRLLLADSLMTWWSPIPILLGMISADFVSGLVHWTADTWGSETMPVLGRRFVRPFRVHHVNPRDFLRRDVIDTNGDVAMIVSAILLTALFIPLTDWWGQAAGLYLAAFCICGLPTNQVHQWAHMPSPPLLVCRLQRWGLLLSRSAHRKHHTSPFVVNYCIATGWCNPILNKMRFFPRMEVLVSRITGLQPRGDDLSFARSVGEAQSTAVAEAPPNHRPLRTGSVHE